MDPEAQLSSRSSNESSSSVYQDDDHSSEVPERTYTSAKTGFHGWSWVDALKTSLSNRFRRSHYISVPHLQKPTILARLLLSIKTSLFSSYVNILLLFVPIGFATYFAKTPPAWIFATNALAIVPLSALLTDATEKIAAEAGDTIGALLSISLGNLVELILL